MAFFVLQQLTQMYHASSAEADFVLAISGSELLFSFNLFPLIVKFKVISGRLKLDANSLVKSKTFFSKSLGAWGGDFVMIVTDLDLNEIRNGVKKSKLDTIMPYNSLML